MAIEEVVEHNLNLLLPEMDIVSCNQFRVTRNAVVEIEEEEADDLLAMIETELRDRHFAPIVRLQVDKGMDPTHRGMLAAELGASEKTIKVHRARVMNKMEADSLADLVIQQGIGDTLTAIERQLQASTASR